jgi:hypothetical protein
VEGFGEGFGVGNVGDKLFGAFECEKLQVVGISADDANPVSPAKKVLSYDMAGVAAGS